MSEPVSDPYTLPPGSIEAQTAGCTCPGMDNGYGLGAYGGSVTGPDGRPVFWIAAGCPLHDATTTTEAAP